MAVVDVDKQVPSLAPNGVVILALVHLTRQSQRSELPTTRLPVIVGIFALVSVAAISLADDAGSRTFWFWFIPQGLACVWAGWALREAAWIAGALGLLPVFLALPFGLPDETFADGPPVALFEVLLFPAYVGLIVGGAVIRRRTNS